MTQTRFACRGSLFYFTDDPRLAGDDAFVYLEDGLLVIDQGRVVASGDYPVIRRDLDVSVPVIDYRPGLIMPGFIDSHVHYVQSDIVASPAPGLLPWLEQYTFPAEAAFANDGHAREVARFFIRQLLAAGTTTAAVFASSHGGSVDALFEAALAADMRLIAGKVMMDRNAPDILRDDTDAGYRRVQQLIERWHGRQRLAYAVTPRFAPTSSETQLGQAGELFASIPGVYLQSHVAENSAEVSWVRELFGWSRSYLDVYEHFGLLGPRAIYAHGIHLDGSDLQRLAETGTALAFCPSSNLFLGSGLLDVRAMADAGVNLALASDVGAGPSLNMLRVMQDAHSVSQLGGGVVPLYPLYLATLGGARALRLEHRIGQLADGADADFIVLDLQADAWLARRIDHCRSAAERLFALMMLGGQRGLRATYCHGRLAHDREHRQDKPAD